MPRETISGIHDCSKALSIKRGCSVPVAQSIVTDVLDVMIDEIMRLGGVQFVDRFTIKRCFKQERQGFNPATEEIMTIPERYTLKLTVGKALFESLNPEYEDPTIITDPMPFKKTGRFKPRLNIARAEVYEDEDDHTDNTSMKDRIDRLLNRNRK